MFENISEEFKKLTTAVDFLSETNAKEIVSFISKKIMEYLDAYTVDVLWKEKAIGGTYLRALWSESKKRPEIKGHLVHPESHAIWSKVFREEKSVWIEGIQSKEYSTSEPT